jgi:hypothetical protein
MVYRTAAELILARYKLRVELKDRLKTT